jgi:hypothetical protein
MGCSVLQDGAPSGWRVGTCPLRHSLGHRLFSQSQLPTSKIICAGEGRFLKQHITFFVIFVFDLRTLFMHVRSNEIVMGVCLLMVKVGDPVQDHQCWIRPENMQTPRTVLKIDENTPGTEIAAETSAAMAASSIVFRGIDHPYSRRLLNKAKLVFQIGSPFNFHWNSFCS